MVGTWNSTAPDGTKSVKKNRPILQTNTTYIESNMVLDHYWDEDANLDGHHKKIEMPVLSGSPTLSTGIDGNFYYREKTTDEARDLQKAEPFIMTNDGTNNQFLQLGFRVLVHWLGSASTPSQSSIKYYHNIALQSASPKGVVRDSEGKYTINFATPLPSINYLVFGSAMRFSSDRALIVNPLQGANKAASFNKSWVKIEFKTRDEAFRDPDVAMIAIVGG